MAELPVNIQQLDSREGHSRIKRTTIKVTLGVVIVLFVYATAKLAFDYFSESDRRPLRCIDLGYARACE